MRLYLILPVLVFLTISQRAVSDHPDSFGLPNYDTSEQEDEDSCSDKKPCPDKNSHCINGHCVSKKPAPPATTAPPASSTPPPATTPPPASSPPPATTPPPASSPPPATSTPLASSPPPATSTPPASSPPPATTPPPASSPAPPSSSTGVPQNLDISAPVDNSCSDKKPCPDKNSKCTGGRCLCNSGFTAAGNNTCFKTPTGPGQKCRVGNFESYCHGSGVYYLCPKSSVCNCKRGYDEINGACKAVRRRV